MSKRWTGPLDSGRMAGIPHFRPRGVPVGHRPALLAREAKGGFLEKWQNRREHLLNKQVFLQVLPL